MKIDITKLETLQNLIENPEKIKEKLSREEELFLLEENQPQMVLLTFKKYNEINKDTEVSNEQELNIRNIRAGNFSDYYDNKTWGKKWDVKETQTTLYYYLVICKNNPSYENKNSKELQSFVNQINKFMNNNRSINSYALKIQNFHFLNKKDPRSGLSNASNQDKKVWNQYAERIHELKSLYDRVMETTSDIVKEKINYCDFAVLLEDFKRGKLDNDYLEDYFAPYKIGRIAENVIKFLIRNAMITEEEIEKMQTERYSKKVFDLQYPVLTKQLPLTNPRRYYVKPVYYGDVAYYVSSEWYESDREYLIDWLKTINKVEKTKNV